MRGKTYYKICIGGRYTNSSDAILNVETVIA